MSTDWVTVLTAASSLSVSPRYIFGKFHACPGLEGAHKAVCKLGASAKTPAGNASLTFVKSPKVTPQPSVLCLPQLTFGASDYMTIIVRGGNK